MNKKLTILGSGESGLYSALLGKKKGYEVFLSDNGSITEANKMLLNQNAIDFEENGHDISKILLSDLIVKSPGIPDKTVVIQKIIENKNRIVSDIEFAYQFVDEKAKVIAITGSNGKTTTTSLTYHLLHKIGYDVAICGNIGESLSRILLKKDYSYYVIEISSFQLDYIKLFKPNIAILTNITPDHLDRYEYNFQNYVDSKFKITSNLKNSDIFIYNNDDSVIINQLKDKEIQFKTIPFSIKQNVSKGAYLENDIMYFNLENGKTIDIKTEELSILGKHNIQNAMASISAVLKLGLSKEEIIKGLQTFKNVSHRLEVVSEWKGIKFINDSKATNVDSVYWALECFEQPIVWLAGGTDKGNNYQQVEKLVKNKVKSLICIGKDNEKLKKYFSNTISSIYETIDMEKAVKIASEVAKKGDIVLLSPACASFDCYKNYEDRGNQFINAVKKLK